MDRQDFERQDLGRRVGLLHRVALDNGTGLLMYSGTIRAFGPRELLFHRDGDDTFGYRWLPYDAVDIAYRDTRGDYPEVP